MLNNAAISSLAKLLPGILATLKTGSDFKPITWIGVPGDDTLRRKRGQDVLDELGPQGIIEEDDIFDKPRKRLIQWQSICGLIEHEAGAVILTHSGAFLVSEKYAELEAELCPPEETEVTE